MATSVSAQVAKATLQYRVVMGINPKDPTQRILRPLIVGKEKYDTARVLHFAIDNGYVTGGQFFSNYGTVNGFLEACMALGKDGKDILLNNWLRIHPELKGTCDPETRQMGSDNELHVCVQAQQDLRRKASEFLWTCVDDTGVRATVQHLQAVGWMNDKEIHSAAKIAVGGAHLNYNAASDKITAKWDTTSEEGEVTHHEVTLTPESSGYSAMVLPYPTGLSSAPEGTIVTFTFFFRFGNPELSVIPAVCKATVVAAPTA